jgi:maleate isomerase
VNSQPRIGLIVPSSNRLTEPQFHRFAPPGVGIHATRLRMTGKWHRPLKNLKESITEAAAALSDVRPDIIVFHCTASSMEDGLVGDAAIAEWIEKAGGCASMTTGQAITQALKFLGVKKLVLITPYVKKTNKHEISYLSEAGFEVVHAFGLGLSGGDEYITVTPERWIEIVSKNLRPEAEAYVLSCTNTTMIEAIEELERLFKKPVVASNQAVLWSCLRKLNVGREIKGPGKLFAL